MILYIHKNSKVSTESCHIPSTKFLLLVIFYVVMVHLSKLCNYKINIDILRLIKLLFLYNWFSSFFFPVFHDVVQVTTLHLFVLIPWPPLFYDGISVFPCFL